MLKLVLLLVFASAGAAAAPFAEKPPAPELDVGSYILMDFDSGAVLAEKNADQRMEPASLTKIMTVYVTGQALAAKTIAMSDMTTISEKAWRMIGSRMFVEVNQKVSVDDLLHGIITQSGNDASVAVAEHVAGTEQAFAALMTRAAHDLGMSGTHFSNSTGMPDTETYTTSRDLARLAVALIRDYPALYARFALPEYTYNGITQLNRNRLLGRDPSVDGIKTGHTESAGYCLVTSARRDGMRLVSAVMGAASDNYRTEASQALLNHGFRFFETRRLYKAGEPVAKKRIWKGVDDEVALGVGGDLFVTIPRGRYDAIDAVAEVHEPIVAPVKQNQPLGAVRVMLSGAELLRAPLVAIEGVGEAPWYGRLADDLRLLFE